MKTAYPRVGVGVIIENQEGQVLIGKRLGGHAPKYSIPGGRLELGESFEQAAIREIEEELGITVKSPVVIAVTNNLETFREEGTHFISIILHTKKFTGEPKNMEPHKCAEIFWCDPRNLPLPHFDASRLAIDCFLNGRVYAGIQ